MHDRPAWAARDRRSADRMGAVMLLAGTALVVLGLAAVGWAPGSGAVAQAVVLVALPTAACVVALRAGRLPWWVYPVLLAGAVVAVAGLVPLNPGMALVGLPLFLLVVVYASHWFGTALSRVVAGLVVVAELRVYVGWETGALMALTLGYVVGITVLVHVLLVRSVDRQAALVSALTHDARHDGLTGWLTRRAFDAELERRTPAPGRTGLLLVDLDDLKGINDRHGHLAGDAAIRHVAGVVGAAVREDDAVVGRLGGDELAVLLLDCAPDAAARRADGLVAAVAAEPLRLPDGVVLPVGISVGAAVSTAGRDLYASADEALYAAKSAGRGRAAGMA